MLDYLKEKGFAAKNASYELAIASTQQKNEALRAIAETLTSNIDKIISANNIDIQNAKQKGITDALLDRLTLTEKRLTGIINDIYKVISIDDPIGSEYDTKVLPNGLRLTKRRIPLGVIGVIYEARPNVTVDIVSLCLKTGNACILRGGSETINSNKVIIDLIHSALEKSCIHKDSVQFIDRTERELVTEFLHMDEYIDMIIPRGGAKLSKLCREQSTIPVIVGGFGISHIFVDETADFDKAIPVIINSKVQRPSACNSLDTLLIHENIAFEFISKLLPKLKDFNVKLYAENKVYSIIKNLEYSDLFLADENTFDTEWLELSLGLKIVKDVNEALHHMRIHNATHSDSILTNDMANANKFVNSVGSAAAYINASTRFTDGGQFGLGAEVAISTQKLHAHGPMGLTELTSYRWICSGDYLVRE